MKKLLNTLFVTTQKAYLNKDGLSVVVNIEHKEALRLPVHNLGGIICFGQVSCSPFLMHFCAENGVMISFLSERGQFLARVQGPVSGNVLLRKAQYRQSEQADTAAAIARSIVIGKIANSRTVLQRYLRDHGESPEITAVILRMKHHLANLSRLELNTDSIRGVEGEAAENYFSVFNRLITVPDTEFSFSGRNRRPPLDPVNAMLSFVYTLLAHDIESALESVGLDPAVGFLHCDRPGRAGLALDMQEEFRAFIADRLVLSLINLKQVSRSGFKTNENGAVTMSDDTRKTILSAYQQRKKEIIEHPFIKEKVDIGLLFFVQARLMAKFLRDELDAYPPFIWR
ncbi:MAG: type I-C CRISPR-associated endonuclease Cas1c [Victivallaceae bacterium]|nr:type I-C CRISPR-associated endonuclease Cas1c [Victivallaceae bacterium]